MRRSNWPAAAYWIGITVTVVSAQVPRRASAIDPSAAIQLAESGRCPQAMPQLKRVQGLAVDPNLKRRIGFAGVRCAMTMHEPAEAASYLAWLEKQFPQDPAVLFLASHVYSDLSMAASNELLHTHPESPEVHELNAETLEMQNKWKEAADEYRVVLAKDPNRLGMHFRLGRVLLSEPNAPPTVKADARREFEQELRIDPRNAGAEFILGELDRQDDHLPQALEHYERAVALDGSFVEAQVELGRTLLDSDQPQQAIAPLGIAENARPADPAVHLYLSMAFRRTGRKADADREAELQSQTSERAIAESDEMKKQITGGNVR